MRIALLNTDASNPALMQVRYLRPAPQPLVSQDISLDALTRTTIDVNSVAGVEHAEISTVIESDVAFVADRTLSWDVGNGYGAHAETAVATPASTWYFAEGATHSGFSLFYLLQNPNAVDAQVRVRFLRPSGAPLEKTYLLPPQFAQQHLGEPGGLPGGRPGACGHRRVSRARETQRPTDHRRTGPIPRPARPEFGAGHESAGVTAPATQWFLAEGNTGPYFDLFVLIANPGNADAQVEATYLLPDGTVIISPTRWPPTAASTSGWMSRTRASPTPRSRRRFARPTACR